MWLPLHLCAVPVFSDPNLPIPLTCLYENISPCFFFIQAWSLTDMNECPLPPSPQTMLDLDPWTISNLSWMANYSTVHIFMDPSILFWRVRVGEGRGGQSCTVFHGQYTCSTPLSTLYVQTFAACFQPLKRQQTARINFLECVMSKEAPPCYAWLSTMQKMINALKCK